MAGSERSIDTDHPMNHRQSEIAKEERRFLFFYLRKKFGILISLKI
jgi:hypothetical protein